MIRNIQLRHAGKYTCAVQTKVDSISIAVDLVVRGKSFLIDQLHAMGGMRDKPPSIKSNSFDA